MVKPNHGRKQRVNLHSSSEKTGITVAKSSRTSRSYIIEGIYESRWAFESDRSQG